MSIRSRVSWSSNFNAEFSEMLFQGSQASYFDSLIYVDGIDTAMVANNGSYNDSTGNVISGHAAIPLNLSEILNGTYLRLSWNREYHLGYGRQILNLDSNVIVYAGVGAKYIQGLAFFDLSSENGELKIDQAYAKNRKNKSSWNSLKVYE